MGFLYIQIWMSIYVHLDMDGCLCGRRRWQPLILPPLISAASLWLKLDCRYDNSRGRHWITSPQAPGAQGISGVWSIISRVWRFPLPSQTVINPQRSNTAQWTWCKAEHVIVFSNCSFINMHEVPDGTRRKSMICSGRAVGTEKYTELSFSLSCLINAAQLALPIYLQILWVWYLTVKVEVFLGSQHTKD